MLNTTRWRRIDILFQSLLLLVYLIIEAITAFPRTTSPLLALRADCITINIRILTSGVIIKSPIQGFILLLKLGSQVSLNLSKLGINIVTNIVKAIYRLLLNLMCLDHLLILWIIIILVVLLWAICGMHSIWTLCCTLLLICHRLLETIVYIILWNILLLSMIVNTLLGVSHDCLLQFVQYLYLIFLFG